MSDTPKGEPLFLLFKCEWYEDASNGHIRPIYGASKCTNFPKLDFFASRRS